MVVIISAISGRVNMNASLFPLSVGEVKPALRIDKNIFLFEYMKLFVRKTISKRANFRHVFENARALDIEK